MQSSYQYQFGNPGMGIDWGNSALSGNGSTLVQESSVHEKAATSVKEFAYVEDKNYRFRPYMEDSKSSETITL